VKVPWISFIEHDLAREEATKNRCARCSKPLVEGTPFARSSGLAIENTAFSPFAFFTTLTEHKGNGGL
jgi:hypothetical protein